MAAAPTMSSTYFSSIRVQTSEAVSPRGRLAVGVEAYHLAVAQLADALLHLPEVADDDPDDLAGAHEFLRGAVELRLGQGAHVRRVARPVVGRQPVVDHPEGGALQGVERLEAGRQPERHVAHDARELLAGQRALAGQPANLPGDLDHRLLRPVGLHRRDDDEGALPARVAEVPLRPVAPVLVEAEVAVEARGGHPAEV